MNTESPLYPQLFRAGKVAVPLKTQDDCLLNPEPNFLVIDNMFEAVKAYFPDANGTPVETQCSHSSMKLVYREILPEGNGKQETIREVELDNIGNQPLPDVFYPLINHGNHQQLIDNEALINSFLPLFSFRGVLEGYSLEYDPAKSQQYLDYLVAQEAARAQAEADRLAAMEAMNNPPAPEPEPAP